MRCDWTAEPPGELIRIATAGALLMPKARSSDPSIAGEVEPRPKWRRNADRAGQPNHRHHGPLAAKPAKEVGNAHRLVHPFLGRRSEREPLIPKGAADKRRPSKAVTQSAAGGAPVK